MTRTSLGVAAASLLYALAASAAPPSSGPRATLEQQNKALAQLLHKREDGKLLTDSLIDFDAFARKSLGEHWDALKQREAFLAAFKKMLERQYLDQLRANLEDEVVYDSEKIDGSNANVTTLIKVHSKTLTSDSEIVYRMHQAGSSWLIYDIVTDEVSLVRNYKTQFHKIITEQGADTLLDKIKAKFKD
jgi:phospholipid transport system substrate-binding protein